MQAYWELERLFQYFKKAINTYELLRKKEKLNQNLILKIETFLQTEYNELIDDDFHTIVKNSRHWNYEIKRIIKHKIEIIKIQAAKTETGSRLPMKNFANTTKMADVDIRRATSLVPMYDGSSDQLESFVDALNLLAEITPADQTATAVRYVKTRLTKRARLGLSNNLATIQDIINDLNARCKSQEKPESLIAKLKQIKKSTTTEFCDEIENLTLKLKSLYMEKQIPEDVANSMATKVGLESLINGIPSSETKIILKAGNFTNIQEAILKVNENTSSQNAQVLFTNTTKQYNKQSFRNNP